jgi:maltooligosyltrehalose trehalohydrolase
MICVRNTLSEVEEFEGERMSASNGELAARRTGAIARRDGSVTWRVWAPLARQVTLVLETGGGHCEIPMVAEARGFHSHVQGSVPAGQRYAYRLDSGPERPDPCSLWQPEGVRGYSAVVFPDRFGWNDRDWNGVSREDLVFYEIHVGTFTPQGTFEAIVPRLDDLCELGVTALELMPVGQFPGARNWGYDGVLPYATQDSYGGPGGLQHLVDECHAHGLAIFLDVVYNHFGPEGNHLGEFGPYFTGHYTTPWGAAVNFDRAGCDAVRDFVLDNVRMWLEEFHFDGLRLDAVDKILDMGARHILRAIKETADATGRRRGWPAIVLAESDDDDPRLLYPFERGGHGLDAQWMDDFHHAAHAFLTGDRHGYYADFGEAIQLARVIEQPYLFHWDYSPFRDRKHGAGAEGLAGDRFVVFLQNHDQVGNRRGGERLGSLLGSEAKQRLAVSYLLLSPYLPLLFMGEEYGEENPFPFFCSFSDPALVAAVCEGRRKEFPDQGEGAPALDPTAEPTFAAARLSWSWPDGTFRAGLRRLYRDLLDARRSWPALHDSDRRTATLSTAADGSLTLDLIRGDDGTGSVRALFNLNRGHLPVPASVVDSRVVFSSEWAKYGGARAEDASFEAFLPFECIVFGPFTRPALDRVNASLAREIK